ncbi:hypothetical protein ACFL54_06740 [Planctomycetota bacterium]
MKLFSWVMLLLLLFCWGCSSGNKTAMEEENTPEETATEADNPNGEKTELSIPEIGLYENSQIKIKIADGSGESVVVEVSRYFTSLKTWLTQDYELQNGGEIGALEIVFGRDKKPVELDFRTGFKIAELGMQKVKVQEQYLEDLKEPAWEAVYDNHGKKVMRKTTVIKKYRMVLKDQIYIVMTNRATGENVKLIQMLY